MARTWTGIGASRHKDPQVRRDLEDIDRFLYEMSTSIGNLRRGTQPIASAPPLGSGGTLTDYFYLPGRNGGQIAHGGSGATDYLSLLGNPTGTVNGWVRIPILTDSTSATPDTNKILQILTQDDVNIFSVQGNGATVINVPYTTYTSGNPVALTLQMDDNTTNGNNFFLIKTNSLEVFSVSYYGAVDIDMSAADTALQIEQFSATPDMTKWVASGGTTTLLGVDGSGNLYGGNLVSSTLSLMSKNAANSTTGRINITSTPTIQFVVDTGTHVPYQFGLGLLGSQSTFAGAAVAINLTATTGPATSPSFSISNVGGGTTTVLMKTIRAVSQSGNLFQWLQENGSTVMSFIDSNGAFNGPMVATTASVIDNAFSILDNLDNTKIAQFQVSGLSVGTRTYTFQDADMILAGTNFANSFTQTQTITQPSTGVNALELRLLAGATKNFIECYTSTPLTAFWVGPTGHAEFLLRSDVIGPIIQGFSSQTQDLMRFVTSAPVTLSFVNSAGAWVGPMVPTATATVETLNTATPATAAAFTPAVSTVGYYHVDLSLSVRTIQASVQAKLQINWTDNGGAQNAYIVQPTDTAARSSNKRLMIFLASGSLTYTTTFTGFGVGRVDVRAKAQRIT